MFTMFNKTILITGGAGFIGSHLVDLLLKLGYKVKIIDNLANGNLHNLSGALQNANCEFLEGDILDKVAVSKIMLEVDYVFHLACLGVRHSIHSPFENHRVNAEGTLNILEIARSKGVRHFFYISTSEIYGRTNTFPITEDAPTNPLTVYGASKLAGEHYTNAFYECYGMNTTVLRIFNNFGPRAHYEGDAGEIIPRSIVRILYGEQPIVFGDGSITRDFFFVKDTAEALAIFLSISQSARQLEISGQTFNIGTGTEVSMKELLYKILELIGSTGIGLKFMPDRPADVPRLWVAPDRFTALTKFTPAYSFEEGLKETILFYKNKMVQKNMLEEIKINNWIKQ